MSHIPFSLLTKSLMPHSGDLYMDFISSREKRFLNLKYTVLLIIHMLCAICFVSLGDYLFSL